MSAARLFVQIRIRRDGQHPLSATFAADTGITALMGPSGSGKSRTLAAIAGLLQPTSGLITANGTTWFDASCSIHVPPEQREVGYVFQSLALFPHLTALGNVAFGIDRSLKRAERIERARSALAALGVEAMAHRFPVTLSGGEAQRVALARALAKESRLLLLDEPFSALDELTKDLVISHLELQMRNRQLVVLLVTHDERDAQRLATTCLRIDGDALKGDLPASQP